jgi:hypothetical protein
MAWQTMTSKINKSDKGILKKIPLLMVRLERAFTI